MTHVPGALAWCMGWLLGVVAVAVLIPILGGPSMQGCTRALHLALTPLAWRTLPTALALATTYDCAAQIRVVGARRDQCLPEGAA